MGTTVFGSLPGALSNENAGSALALPATSTRASSTAAACTSPSAIGSNFRQGLIMSTGVERSAAAGNDPAYVGARSSLSRRRAGPTLVPAVAPPEPVGDRRQGACLEIGADQDRLLCARRHHAAARRRLHRRKVGELGSARRVGEVAHEIGGEIVAERRSLPGRQRLEVLQYEVPRELGLLAGAGDAVEHVPGERGRQLVA